MSEPLSSNLQLAAKEAGAMFYTLPSELKIDEQIDPLLRAAVRAINRSGLVWTAESCQGHPDEADLHAPWGFSVEPYLRMVCLKIHLAWAIETLLEAAHDDNDASHGPVGMRLYTRPLKDGWVEFKVYATATNAATRNRGCRALERFGFALEQELRPAVETSGCVAPPRAQHGRDCPKVQHVGEGYLHAADDDRPYEVDGLLYCGRCHGWLDRSQGTL